MNFDIDENILKETTQCEYDFSCLTGGKGCFCEVEDYVEDKVLFVEFKVLPGRKCHYMFPFGSSFMCTCPTRKEIYRKYSI